MSGQMPGVPPSGPPQKKGLSNGWIVALIIVGIIVLLFGVCVALTSGGGA